MIEKVRQRIQTFSCAGRNAQQQQQETRIFQTWIIWLRNFWNVVQFSSSFNFTAIIGKSVQRQLSHVVKLLSLLQSLLSSLLWWLNRIEYISNITPSMKTRKHTFKLCIRSINAAVQSNFLLLCLICLLYVYYDNKFVMLCWS